jgi:RNA polymerase sigma-70 factor (ECF subfamily)
MRAAILPWTAAWAMSAPPGDAPPREHLDAVAQGDDAERAEALYVRLEPKLTNALYRWLWNREEVRDVIQDAFVRLWQMRERIDWERAEPLVYRIALNLAAKRRRSRHVWRWVGLDRAPELQDPEDAAVAEEEAAVRRAIDRLPERLRRVLVLQIHSELSHEEIAEVLRIPVGTVGSRRNAAVAKLRAALLRSEVRR